MGSKHPLTVSQVSSPIEEIAETTSSEIPLGNFQTGQLLPLLTAALQTNSPLTHLLDGLGQAMGFEGCLLVGQHHRGESLTLVLWERQQGPQLWQFASAQSPLSLEQRDDIKRGGKAQSLLGWLLKEQDLPNSWLELLRDIVGPGDALDALRKMQTYRPITVPNLADDQVGGVFFRLQDQPWQSQAEVDWSAIGHCLAIAFQQHSLAQQARKSIEQLRYVNDLKDDFLSTLNHELRTPLTSMMLAIRMLKRPDLTPERQAMYLEILEQQCSQETALVNDLLTLRNIESNQTSLVALPVNLNQFLQSLVDSKKASFEAAGLTLCLNLPAQWMTLETVQSDLTRIFQELLANACKYAQPGSTVTLNVVKPPGDFDSVQIELINQGAGIQVDELPHIFDKFRRGRGATQRAIPGTGTGLALVQGLVKRLSGNISVKSTPIPGSRANAASDQYWQTCFTLSFRCRLSKPYAAG